MLQNKARFPALRTHHKKRSVLRKVYTRNQTTQGPKHAS